jgi:hypothetical protein
MTEPSHKVATRRAYEPRAPGDGVRILVDRLWPAACARTLPTSIGGADGAVFDVGALLRSAAQSGAVGRLSRHHSPGFGTFGPTCQYLFVRRIRAEGSEVCDAS